MNVGARVLLTLVAWAASKLTCAFMMLCMSYESKMRVLIVAALVRQERD